MTGGPMEPNKIHEMIWKRKGKGKNGGILISKEKTILKEKNRVIIAGFWKKKEKEYQNNWKVEGTGFLESIPLWSDTLLSLDIGGGAWSYLHLECHTLLTPQRRLHSLRAVDGVLAWVSKKRGGMGNWGQYIKWKKLKESKKMEDFGAQAPRNNKLEKQWMNCREASNG